MRALLFNVLICGMVLYWLSPVGQARGEQLALLASQLHERQSSAAYADLLAEAEDMQDETADPAVRRNLALLRLELERLRQEVGETGEPPRSAYGDQPLE